MLRWAGALRSRSFVHSYIIHEHGFRKNGGCVRISGPATSNCDVEQKEKWMVINPLRSLGQVGGSSGCIKVIVDIETDCAGCPLDGEDVKVFGKGRTSGKSVRRANTVRAGISRTVNGAVNESGLFTDVLHDVNLAAGRPAGFFDVVAQHPEGGADPPATRGLGGGL